MDRYQLMTTNLTLQFTLTETQFLGDNRQSFEQQKLILLRALMCLLDSSQQQLSPKQFETLFFNLIKSLSHESQQILATALESISAISAHVSAAFFATRSITTIYEKFSSLRPECIRLLGKVANSASIGDLERLIKQAMADKNERLVTSALIAARRSKIAVEADATKIIGCGGYIFGQVQELDKLLGCSKNVNEYCELAILQRVPEIEDERKRMQAILEFIPGEARDLREDWFFVYLEALKQLNNLNFSIVKVNLHTVLEFFIMVLEAARSDTQKIAIMRQVLKIYAQIPREGELFEQISEALRRAASENTNTVISALALTSLVAANPDEASIARILEILPGLTGAIKADALGALSKVAENADAQDAVISTADGLLDSSDAATRECGFEMLFAVLQQGAAIASAAAALLLDKIESCDDPMQCRQACEALCQAECDQVKLIDVLLEKAVLGGEEVRSAAFAALKEVQAKSAEQQPRIANCASLAIKAFETDEFEDFDVVEPDLSVQIPDFDPADFLMQQELLLGGNFDKIQFGLAAKAASEKKFDRAQIDSEIARLIEPGYEEMFTRGEFEQASSQTLDVSVSLCKVFIQRAGAKYVQFLYKVVPDEGVEANDVEIRIGKTKSTQIDKTHYYIIIQYSRLEDIRLFQNIKMRYSNEDEDETVRLFDVAITTYDLIQAVEVENYAQYFADNAETTDELVIHLQDIPDVATALENIPSFCGLLNVEVTNETYKKATFFMTGKLNGVGDIVCKADIKLSKVGVKAKLHCVGPAASQFYSIFE